MMEAVCSSITSILTKAIPEDGILHSHRRENLNLTKVFLFQIFYIPSSTLGPKTDSLGLVHSLTFSVFLATAVEVP
jgi:hypothetical protein